MALLPYALRPSVIIRRKAIWGGVLGTSTFWKIVAVGVFGKKTFKAFFGKQPEKLGTYRVASNQFVNVINAKPMTKRQRKRSGVTKAMLKAQAKADVRAARPGRPVKIK